MIKYTCFVSQTRLSLRYNWAMAKLWLHQSDSYEISTEIYSGPLDLLLDLIQKAELDINKLALAQVTDQFLDYIEAHKTADPDYLSEFLIIATKLVQIKSESLLPRPPVKEEDEEDLGETLARQLLIYREIKKTSKWLSERLANDFRSYQHIPQTFPVNVQLDLTGLSITDLIMAIENLSNRQPSLVDNAVINIPRMTLKNKVEDIVHILRKDKQTSLSAILGDNTDRIQTIVVFLAILELVKQHLIKTDQNASFGDINLFPEDDLFETDETELEINEL